MVEIVKDMQEQEIHCIRCPETAIVKTFVLCDTRPYRQVTYIECKACGFTESMQDNTEDLDYGVKITCKLNCKGMSDGSGAPQDLNRMVFTNSNANISIVKEGEVLLEFICTSYNIDSVEGLLMRGKDLFSYAQNDKDDSLLKEIGRKFEGVMNGDEFTLIIEDNSGYSKVCPLGKEYSQIQDEPIESLNEDTVTYEKISKKTDA